MKITKTNEEWKSLLSSDSYLVARESATERAFSGKYYDHKDNGIYSCICCEAPLFDSTTKFDSGTGWPSFYDSIKGSLVEIKDNSYGMIRVEVRCSKCDAHLGHLFTDGPNPTQLRYCINSVCLNFKKEM